jgi:hypothetical protein
VKSVTVARRETCFSKGGTAPGTSDIHVLWPDDLITVSPTVKQLRATLEVENATVNCQTKVVMQTTEDACTWPSPAIGLEAQFTAGNRKTTTAWEGTPANFKRGIRLGLLVEQAAGTAVETCKVTVVVDIEFKS